MINVRPSVLAGTWYPEDPVELRLSIESWMARHRQGLSAPAPVGRLIGLVLPHAGHLYSGLTMAAGVARIARDRVSRVVLIGPSHRMAVRGAAVSGATHFETPLGAVPVDADAVRRLHAAGVGITDAPHAKEHSLEIILPFLQAALESFSIVPILAGLIDDDDREFLGRHLGELLDDRTILIASSDFIHYGAEFDYMPDVGRNVRAGVRKLDEEAIEYIRAMDVEKLLAFRRKTGATICGILPIAVAMAAFPKSTRVDYVHYSQSADVSGDTGHMVSYAALAFYAP